METEPVNETGVISVPVEANTIYVPAESSEIEVSDELEQ